MKFVAWALALMNKLGPSLDEALPHIKNIGVEIKALLTIANGGHPVSTGSSPTTAEGSQLREKLTSAKMNATEAGQLVALLETADSRLGS